MNRRSLVILLGLMGLSRLVPKSRSGAGPIRFAVSGVRFHLDAPLQQEGSDLEIRTGSWKGHRTLALHGSSGHRVGFVPKELVPVLAGRVDRVVVVRARPHALPWNRYLVEVKPAQPLRTT